MNAKTRILQEAALRAADRGEPVYLGNSSGVVAVPGEPGRVWVTDQRGDVQKVWNVTVPNAPGVCVFIKRIDKRMQVTAMWDVYSNWIYPKIGPHNMLHEWGAAGTDIVRTWGDVFMPWKVEPTTGFTVRVYRAAFYASTGWLPAGTQDIVITPWTTGAGSGKYVLLSTSTLGAVTVTYGTSVQADYNNLTVADIPALPTGDRPLFAIRLFEGQTQLAYNPSLTDFIDLRHMQGIATITPGVLPTFTANRLLITDGSGVIGTDSNLYYSNKQIIMGAVTVPATNPIALHLVAEGTGATYDNWVCSDTDAPYYVAHRARGTIATPGALALNDVLMYIRGRGYDGSWTGSRAGLSLVADGTWDATHHPTRIDFSATTNGSSASMGVVATMYGSGVLNIPTGGTYNINGAPHVHNTGRRCAVRIITGSDSATSVDEVIVCNSTSALTVTLPTATGSGQAFTIKNINTGAVTVSVAGDTIDGVTSQILGQWDGMDIVDVSANVWIIT